MVPVDSEGYRLKLHKNEKTGIEIKINIML